MVQLFGTFDGNELKKRVTLFPGEIESNLSVMYHATSSVYEDQIDAEGLEWKPRICSLDEILELLGIFRSMNWCGEQSDGYPVLEAFTLTGDFRGSNSKPIYFRESSNRSLAYATREFAGGESAMAIRKAFNDLDSYLREPSIREAHYSTQRRKAITLAQSGALPNRVIRVNTTWLAHQVEQFHSLRDRCNFLQNSHSHGVLYAVRFLSDDLLALNYDASMGIRCYVPMPVDRIIGKVRLVENGFPWIDDCSIDIVQHFSRISDPNGLVYALKLADSEGRSHPSVARAVISSQENAVPIYTSAGIDEAIEIAETYGSRELADFMRRSDYRCPYLSMY